MLNARAIKTFLYRRIRRPRSEIASLLYYAIGKKVTRSRMYISHHKCATQYTMRILLSICRFKELRWTKYDWRYPVRKSSLYTSDLVLIPDFDSSIIELDAMTIPVRGFHVIRDPRDILVSMYFSHRDSHVLNTGELRREREALRKLDQDRGLRYIMENSTYFRRVLEEIEAWDYEWPRFLEVKFEKLTANPLETFTKISNFLQLPITPNEVEEVVQENSFQSLRREWNKQHPGRKRSHYRKGKPGDWRKHLHDENKVLFKERYGELLIRLGYEEDFGW